MVAFSLPSGLSFADGEVGSSPVVLLSQTECCPDEAWAAVEDAVLDELVAMDVPAELVQGVATGTRERRIELAVVAEEHNAASAIRIVRDVANDQAGIDLYTVDRVSGNSVSRHISVRDAGNPETVPIAAIRCVEALRASLQELHLPFSEEMAPVEPEPIPEEPPPAPAVVEPEKEAPQSPRIDPGRGILALGAGGQMALSSGDVGPMGGLEARLLYRPLRWLLASLDVSFLIWLHDINVEDLSSDVDFYMVRPWVLVEIFDDGLLRPALGIGGGLVVARAVGREDAIHDDSTDMAVVAYMGGSVQLGLAFTDSFWLRAGAKLGAFLPPVEVRMGEASPVKLGIPIFEGFVAAELYFL